MCGIQDVAFLEDYRKKYEDLKAYPDFCLPLVLRCGRPGVTTKAMQCCVRAQKKPDPVFYTLMGNNYRDLGAVAEAESAYRKAFGMLPGAHVSASIG